MSYAKSALAKKATPRKNQKTLESAGKSNYQVSRAATASTAEKGKPRGFRGLIFVLTAAIAKLLLSFAKYKNEFYDDQASADFIKRPRLAHW